MVQATELTVELVYYPPYHSKYNPIERCWGVLEVYWNGELLDSEEAVLGFAANMTYAGRHPHVDRVSAAYCSGVRRSSAEKKLLEGRLMRQPSLPKWSVTIAPPKPDEIFSQLEAQAAPILTPREEHRIPTKWTSYFLSAA